MAFLFLLSLSGLPLSPAGSIVLEIESRKGEIRAGIEPPLFFFLLGDFSFLLFFPPLPTWWTGRSQATVMKEKKVIEKAIPPSFSLLSLSFPFS